MLRVERSHWLRMKPELAGTGLRSQRSNGGTYGRQLVFTPEYHQRLPVKSAAHQVLGEHLSYKRQSRVYGATSAGNVQSFCCSPTAK